MNVLSTLRSFSPLEWIFTLGQVFGSIIIASNLGINVLGYVFFLASSIAGIVLLRGTHAARSVVLVNVYFTVVDTIGIVRYSL